MVTKNVIDCDIWQSGSDIPDANDCVSICTMENLVYYKLAQPKPGSVQHALFLVSSVEAANESRNGSFMIDYVEAIGSDAIEDYRVLRKLATLAKNCDLFSNSS